MINKIRDMKEPTFNDLIDAAAQAFKDGALAKVTMMSEGLIYLTTHDIRVKSVSDDIPSSGIDFIKSLYTETFVIESEENTDKIDVFKCPRFELKNGVRGTIQKCFNNKEFSVQFEDKSWGNIGFMVLKGATVTQSAYKGENNG